jgi:hypothetical protein
MAAVSPAVSPMAASPAAANPVPAQPLPPVSVIVHAAGTQEQPSVGYTLTLQSNVDAPQLVIVTQKFAAAPVSLSALGDGKVLPDAAQWTVELPPMQAVPLNSEVVYGSIADPTRSTACVADVTTGRMLECASGDLPAEMAAIRAEPGLPWLSILGWAVLLLVLAAAVYGLYRVRARWLPQLTEFAKPRRNLLAIVGSVLALLVISAGLVGYGVTQMRSVARTATENSVLTTQGQQHIQAGLPGMAGKAEFTVFQWGCMEQETRQCLATVSIRNTSEQAQPWHRRMQRLHLANEKWAEPDLETTVAANAGADIFATPLGAGERRMAVLVFKFDPATTPAWLELRDGAYPRGVALEF